MTAEGTITKVQLRKECLKRRDSIPDEVRAVKDREIMERLISYPPFAEAKTVLLFASFRSEINTFPLMEHILKEGKGLLLPRVNNETKSLELYLINSLDELIKGYMGIMEPDPEMARRADTEDIDLVVLPGAAFDERGGRIGYGGGYYDRLIASLQCSPHLIAIAYEEQIVEHVPLEEHDQRVRAIITDRRVIEV